MTTSTRPARWVILLALCLGIVGEEAAFGPRLLAQAARPDASTLRTQVERRYEALPIRDGLVLRPRTATPEVRSVEIAGGTIALDGQPVTGAELRRRLPADADLILQLSYLDDAARRSLFGLGGASTSSGTASPSSASSSAAGSGTAPAAPAPPAPPAVPTPESGSALPAPPPPPPPPAPPAPSRRGRKNDIVRFGGEVTVDEDDHIQGDVVVMGGAADIKGIVDGNVVVVGGTMTLGPKADVRGDAVVVGGVMQRDPGAKIGGEVQEVAMGPLNFRFGRGGGRQVADWWTRGPWGSVFSLFATLVRLAIFALLAALVMLFARDYT